MTAFSRQCVRGNQRGGVGIRGRGCGLQDKRLVRAEFSENLLERTSYILLHHFCEIPVEILRHFSDNEAQKDGSKTLARSMQKTTRALKDRAWKLYNYIVFTGNYGTS